MKKAPKNFSQFQVSIYFITFHKKLQVFFAKMKQNTVNFATLRRYGQFSTYAFVHYDEQIKGDL